MEAQDFWNDQASAQETVKEANRLKGKLKPFLALEKRYENLEAAIELAREFDDADSAKEATDGFGTLSKDIDSFELVTLLDKPSDPSNAFLTIQAGAGGTEACDWAQMLMRMYMRWAEQHGFKVTITDGRGGRGDFECLAQDRRRLRLRLPEDRARRAPPGADLTLRRGRQTTHLVCGHRRHPGDLERHQDRDSGE